MTASNRKTLTGVVGVFALFAALFAVSPISSQEKAKEQDAEAPKKKETTPAEAVEVRFVDDSTLKLRLRDERLELETAYGKTSRSRWRRFSGSSLALHIGRGPQEDRHGDRRTRQRRFPPSAVGDDGIVRPAGESIRGAHGGGEREGPRDGAPHRRDTGEDS